MKNCYILFVITGKEDEVAQRLQQNAKLKPFVPKKEYYFMRNGVVEKQKKICFKSYVFVESELSPGDFITLLMAERSNLTKDVIRILNYGNRLDIAMREEERSALMKLFGADFCLGISQAYLVGGRVRIISGALVGMESTIKKVKMKQKEVLIEMEFMGGKRDVWVGLDVIENMDLV